VAALIERSALSDAVVATELLNPATPFLRRTTPPGDIRRYAELTGGPVLTSGPAETADRMAALLDQIRVRYTIGYKPAGDKPPGTFCRIRLTATPAAEARVGKLNIRTRTGYFR
jgi:hypothetical protein